MLRFFWFSAITLTALWAVAALPAQYPVPDHDPQYADAGAHIFRPEEVMLMDVTMDPAHLNFFFNNPRSDAYAPCTVRLRNSVIDETYGDVGIRPRGSTARGAKKFPWQLKFNEFTPGQRAHGVEEMNLNPNVSDPTFTRAATIFRVFRAMGVPASRTHQVWLTINDGRRVQCIYTNTEEVDDWFVEAWFGDASGDLYKCRNLDVPANLSYIAPGTPQAYRDKEAYEEIFNDENFVAFADFVNFVNLSSDAEFAARIGDLLNVDGFLRAMAVDMTCGQWDGYWIGANNYYLYQNRTTGRFEYIPWDLDNCFGIDFIVFPILGDFNGTNWATRAYEGWGDRGFGGEFPDPPVLIRRLLEVPQYDQLLQRHARAAADGPFHPRASYPFVDLNRMILDPYAFQGSFSGPSMDNGYTYQDFIQGFDHPAAYQAFTTPCTWGLKPFLERRAEFIAEDYPLPPPLPRVFVNEVVAKNDSGIRDERGEREDWVELYNDEDTAVDLSGAYLGDHAGDPRQWALPAGAVIPPKGFRIVWCDEETADGPWHANFKLDADGEGVYLWRPDAGRNVALDSLLFPPLAGDAAFGRDPDGSSRRVPLPAPTPGTANGDGSFRLALDGHCPGVLTLYAPGAPAGGTVAFLAAAAPGAAVVPPGQPCAGTVLGLDGPTAALVGLAVADANGTAVLARALPAAYCGRLYLQALDLLGCRVSAVVRN